MTQAALSAAQKRHLRGLAHALKPVILVGGKGVTDALIAELDQVLERHELVKVKVAAEDRETRDAWIELLVERSEAAAVQRVGHTVTLFRASRDKPTQIPLPRG
jgi:RNA-binding protein